MLALALLAATLSQTQPAASQPQAAAEPARAQEVAATTTDAPAWQHAQLRLRVEPSLWYMGPGGELKLPSPTLAGEGEDLEIDELGFDSPELVPHIEAHVFAGRNWRFGVRGFTFSDDQTTLMSRTGRIGDIGFDNTSTMRSGLDYSTFEIEAAYGGEVLHNPRTTADGRRRFTARLEGIAGLRLIDIDWEVERISTSSVFLGGSRAAVDETYIQLLGGGRFAFAFNEEWGVDLTLMLGASPFGDATSFSGDVIVGGTYEPRWAPNFGIQLGYRSAFFSLASGDGQDEFEYAGAHQGLMLGVVLKF
jgi:hypothetical protein